jgi:hypothetical protein
LDTGTTLSFDWRSIECVRISSAVQYLFVETMRD